MMGYKMTYDGAHPAHASRVRKVFSFTNGYEASVVKFPGSYGYDENKWELAVMHEGALVYDTPITDDVEGHLTDEDVTALLEKIDKLPKRTKIMQAILINPSTKTIEVITYNGDWRTIAPTIKAQSNLFDCVRVTEHTDMYVDDEGLLIEPNPNGYFHWRDDARFMGPIGLAACALLLDHDDEGASKDVSVTVDWVRERVRWFDGVIGLREA